MAEQIFGASSPSESENEAAVENNALFGSDDSDSDSDAANALYALVCCMMLR